jgi:hypothetical protein
MLKTRKEKPRVAMQCQYWVVSPNVKDDQTKNQETVKQWKEVIHRDHVAIMGWSPEDYEHGHGVGPKFAYDVQMGDIVLIARRKNGKPDLVALGIVSGKLKKEVNKYREIYDEGSVFVRKLHPFVLIQETPSSVPLLKVLKCTWAMHELHPDRYGSRYDSHKKVCSWMNQQLGLTNHKGNNFRIRKKPLGRDKSEPEPTYDYEVRTKKQVRAARRKEKELLDNYERWLEKQGRKLSRLQIGQMECDAWEDERQNLIEAKGTINRQDIRMAVGQLLDYAHHIRKDLGDPNKAILLPEKPNQNDAGWVESAGINIIWRSGRRFQDNTGGQFT